MNYNADVILMIITVDDKFYCNETTINSQYKFRCSVSTQVRVKVRDL